MSFEGDKSEWNMGEQQLIIPMTDEDIVITKASDKFLTSVIPLNALNEEEGQILLPNVLENGLVIGLDRDCLENVNKKEVLVIQNSNMKLQSFDSESYTLSYVNDEKTEILWKGLLSRETNKSDFEDKEVLQCNESMVESSNLAREFEDDSIFLSRDKVILTSQNSRIEDKIILSVKEVNKNNNGVHNISKDLFVINDYSTVQGSCTNKQHIITNNLKPTESKILVISNENQNETFEKGNSHTTIDKKNLPLDFRQTTKNNPRKKLKAKKVLEFDMSNNCLDESLGKEKSISTALEEIKAKDSLDNNEKVVSSDTRSSLLEKSLPLKKKAKMKNTVSSLFSHKNEISKCFSKDKTICQDDNNTNLKKKIKNGCILRKSKNSDVDCKLLRKKNKIMRLNLSKNNASGELIEQEKVSPQKNNNCLNQTGDEKTTKLHLKNDKFFLSRKLENERDSNEKLCNSFPFNFNDSEFDNIYDLVECLKKSKFINSSLWEILHSGLKEMDVDILQEMRSKCGTECSTDCSSYSPQLKAFALVLYFKQPAAFHHLANIYNNGWPSLNAIKEWKRRINCAKRINFIQEKEKF